MPLAASRVLRTFRYAMLFDGVDDSVFIADNSSLRHRTFTVFVYAYMTAWAGGQQGLFYKTGSAPGYWMFLEVNAPAHGYRVRHILYDASTGASYGYYMDYRALTWFSTALVYDGLNAYSYLNASIMNTGSLSIDMTKNTNPIRIGFPLGNPNPVLVFTQLYYSRALSRGEVLWNHAYPENPIRNGLVLWLQADPQYVKDIDGDGVLEWVDLSGFGNHGKIYGATLVRLTKTPTRVLTPVRVLKTLR
jgi:hypothetical protein